MDGYLVGAVIFLILIFVTVKLAFRKTGNLPPTGRGRPRAAFDPGSYGESLTLRELRQFKNAYILSNLYIPAGKGRVTEVDLVMITKQGVFVIETKQYKGSVRGHQDHKYWTQVYRDGSKKTFYNPIWQNRGISGQSVRHWVSIT